MSDLDRQLVFLLEELTDCRMMFPLKRVVGRWDEIAPHASLPMARERQCR